MNANTSDEMQAKVIGDAVIPAKAGIQVVNLEGERSRLPCVYILATHKNGTLYVGVTSNLVRRVWQHKNDYVKGFSQKHAVHSLVWFEVHATMESAIAREKHIKEWRRKWKLQLIEERNPEWRDLYDSIVY